MSAFTILLASFALLVPAALGQSYPSKPLRLIVPFSAPHVWRWIRESGR